MRHSRWMIAALACILLLVGIIAAFQTADEPPIDTSSPAPQFKLSAERVDVWAVGDGADASDDARKVASIIDRDDPDLLLYLGDVYPRGSDEDFAERFDTVYGPLSARTAPTPGNHDWPNHDQGYDPYWKRTHSQPVPAYYTLNAAGWQVLSLNSELTNADATRQLEWLGKQLARRKGTCRIAFLHRPRYSAGKHGDQPDTDALWRKLRRRAAIVVAGHDHNMQRFKPINGTTLLISGAGGHGLYDVNEHDPRLAFANDDTFGALHLTLTRSSARVEFIASDGELLDTATLRCVSRDSS